MEPAERAAALFRNMNKDRRDVFKAWRSFSDTVKRSSTLDAKTQSLIMLACGIMAQCDVCISLHVQGAVTNGADRDEIIDAALLAMAMGGSPKMMYMQYVYEELDKLLDK
jgi:AhpD family alkylhydroperoxidase